MEESDSEPEPEPAKKAPVAAPLAKASAPAADSSSGSDSDSDSPPKKPESNGTNVKPITSKPMVEREKKPSSSALSAKKATAKATKAPAPASPATGMKRLATPSLTQDADMKRSKIENSVKKGPTTEGGKKLFERIFTTEDEIIVLEELLKKYPIPKESSEMDSFYESIKGQISVPVTKAQVLDKIRRLRIKFFNKKEKFANKKEKKKKGSNNEEENGKDDLETVVYELSKKIWGNEEGPKSGSKRSTGIALKFEQTMEKDEGMEKNEETMEKDEGMEKNEETMEKDEGVEKNEETMEKDEGIEKKRKKKKKKKKEEEKGGLSYARDGKSVEKWIFGEGTELVAEEARGNLEKDWKEMRKEEAQLLVKKLELSHKHAKMVLDSMSW